MHAPLPLLFVPIIPCFCCKKRSQFGLGLSESLPLGPSAQIPRVVFVAHRCFMSEQNIGSKFYTQGRIIRTTPKKERDVVLHAVHVRGCHRLFATEAQAGAAEVACWCRSACSPPFPRRSATWSRARSTEQDNASYYGVNTEQDNASYYGVNRKELKWNGRVCPD